MSHVIAATIARIVLVVTLTLYLTPPEAQASEEVRKRDVVVFAASSLAVVMPALERAFQADYPALDMKVSYAATSTLARQITAGAPANIFASANRDWARHLLDRNLIAADNLAVLARNRLVLVTPHNSRLRSSDLALDQAKSLMKALGDRRFAIADPRSVPAGIYGRQALSGLGVWQALKNRLAITANVRAALLLAERGEVPLALVYVTDAQSSSKVRQVAAISPNRHDSIDYMIGLVAGRANLAARTLYAFLLSETAAVILCDAGFAAPPSQNNTQSSLNETTRQHRDN